MRISLAWTPFANFRPLAVERGTGRSLASDDSLLYNKIVRLSELHIEYESNVMRCRYFAYTSFYEIFNL
ncbi:hypothetical protein JCM10914A_41410 [Paenibacillus sp. JCM 10914]